jgi:uncharacterized protein (TIGR00730 family)
METSSTIRSICVFCGSNPGNDPQYRAAAAEFGREIASRGIRLVYGGGRTGLMGQLADSALSNGADVIGVIPRTLVQREVAHTGLTELRVVDSMHERKATMSSLADAFVALPGGLGTLEEIFEVWTWTQLGIHKKMVGFLNVAGYYDGLIQFLETMVAQQFLPESHRAIALFESAPLLLLDQLARAFAPAVPKWLELNQT